MEIVMRDGLYAYRFSGYSMKDGSPYYLVGVGTLTLQNYTITGEHGAAITRLTGTDATAQVGTFTLTERADIHAVRPGSNLLTATVQFESEPGSDVEETLVGDFYIVSVGDDRFWLISTKSRHVGNSEDGLAADEIVSGEGFRIGDVPAPAQASQPATDSQAGRTAQHQAARIAAKRRNR
jgi:hypothetical protein